MLVYVGWFWWTSGNFQDSAPLVSGAAEGRKRFWISWCSATTSTQRKQAELERAWRWVKDLRWKNVGGMESIQDFAEGKTVCSCQEISTKSRKSWRIMFSCPYRPSRPACASSSLNWVMDFRVTWKRKGYAKDTQRSFTGSSSSALALATLASFSALLLLRPWLCSASRSYQHIQYQPYLPMKHAELRWCWVNQEALDDPRCFIPCSQKGTVQTTLQLVKLNLQLAGLQPVLTYWWLRIAQQENTRLDTKHLPCPW